MFVFYILRPLHKTQSIFNFIILKNMKHSSPPILVTATGPRQLVYAGILNKSLPQGIICRLTSGSHLIPPVVPPNLPPEAPQSAATKLLPQGPGVEFGWNRNPHTAPLVPCGSCHIPHWPHNTPCPSLAGANCHSGTHTPSTGCRPAMATSLACCSPFFSPSLP